jgi:two-component system response regulator YesN
MRVLVVENEYESREGLAAMIRSLKPDTTVSTAKDAMSGLSEIAAAPPDLIFLDIRMPGMDGLSMLERIRHTNPNLPVAIISAFDEFAYAQKALRLGACDYLVKPCPAEAIGQILRHTAPNPPSSSIDPINKPYPTDWQNLSALPRWLKGLAEYPAALSQGHTGGFLSLAIARSDDADYLSHVAAALEDDFRVKAREWFAPYGACHVFRNQASGEDAEYVMAALCSGAPSCPPPESIRAFFQEIAALAMMRHGLTMTVAVGGYADDLTRRPGEIYYPLKALAEYSFYLPNGPMLPGDVAVDAKRAFSRERLRSVERAIREGLKNDVNRHVTELFADAAEPPYMPPQRLRYALHAGLSRVIGKLGASLTPQARDLMIERVGALCSDARRLEALESGCRALCLELAEAVEDTHKARASSIMEHCLEYMRAHCGDPALTLDGMAARCHYSPGYFGTLFKQETGQAFVQCLNRMRVEKACGLLMDSRLKVYEIAQRVGFSDFRYFIRVFKQSEGQSPNQYRTAAAHVAPDSIPREEPRL